jgi:hypothetical protein
VPFLTALFKGATFVARQSTGSEAWEVVLLDSGGWDVKRVQDSAGLVHAGLAGWIRHTRHTRHTLKAGDSPAREEWTK